MTSQPVEANVVLTTDNAQYDQAMMGSAQSTDALGKSIDSLGQKINQLSKSAGKKLLTFTAADVALIGGATAALSSYEKQMSRLQSQSAILSRTSDQQNRTMKDYTGAVKGLRSEFGTTTAEAAKLVGTLSKVTGLRQSRDLGELSKVFVEMSHATGESSEGLANSLTNLQKIMGTEINSKNTRQYADTFTYLSSQTNMSATGLADFTAQLAPMGRSIGMNEKQVAGFATAFTRAGSEGMGAATVFTKVTGDISKSLASGSPEIAHYANLIGVTNKQFKSMDGGEQLLRIMESISAMGPQAATELERLGLDGTRSMRAIQAVINEKGGIREALGMADDPRASGSSQRGSEASMKSLNDEYDHLRENLKQTAEAMGSYFMPAMNAFVSGMVVATQAVENLAEGPLGEFTGMVMRVIAPLAGGAGAMLLFAGALLKIAGAFTLLRNSGSRGIMEGLRGGSRIVQGADGRFAAAGGGTLGVRGAQIAEQGTWFQRGLYNTGQAIGAPLAGIGSGSREGWIRARQAVDPNWSPSERRRGPLSYLAGGLGRGIETFATPLWDQMRYDDPTKRSTWLGRQAPWASLKDTQNLSKAMGQTGLAQAQYQLQKSQVGRIEADPMLTNAQRKQQLDNVRQIQEETKQRIDAGKAAEIAARDEIAAKRTNTAETDKNSKGFGRLTRAVGGFTAGMGGGLYGAGKAGVQGIMASGMAGQAGGMAATVAGGATGSQALMLGGTGAMIGSMVAPGIGTAVGAGIGTIAGLAMDASGANDSLTDSLKNLDDQAAEVAKSGSGLSDFREATAKHREELDKFEASVGSTAEGRRVDEFWNAAPSLEKFKQAPSTVKNWLEGAVGSSDVEEGEREARKREDKAQRYEVTARELAKTGGVDITGTPQQQLKQLDEFMSTEGAQMLDDAKVDFKDLAEASKTTGFVFNNPLLPGAQKDKGKSQYDLFMEKIEDRPLGETVEDRVATTQGGRALMGSDEVKKSVRLQGDVGAFYDATNHLFTTLKESGLSNLEILRQMKQATQDIRDDNNRYSEIAGQVALKAQQSLTAQAPGMGRAGAFQQQIDIGKSMMSIKPTTPQGREDIEQAKQMTVQAFQDQDAYFRQLILAQQAYERNRARAQQDYSIQRSYQEYDFQLSRERAEESFNRNRARAVADYYRNVRRAHYDFNLQRRRQEQDFNHQVEVMTKQQAMSVYNIYERVQAQRTSSANWLLSNAGDQLKRMEEQAANLDKLRKMGVSTNVIQQMKLDDPQNAQQLSRFVTELTPQMIRQFNKVAGTQRLKAAKELVTDPSSLEWREMVRSHRQSMDRAAMDMRRTMRQGRQDFRRGLKEMDEDFDIMMEDQAEDYVTNMNRQEKQYKRTMDQAAEDMGHMADEVLGSITDVLVQAGDKLTGAAQTQARQALAAFRNLKNEATPEAEALMKELSQVFGFKYTSPLKGGGDGNRGQPASPRSISPANRAAGGVLPGYTPGVDVHHFTSKTAGDLNLSGGEAVMVPEWTKAVGGKGAVDDMNRKARGAPGRSYLQGPAFAQGGVWHPGRRSSDAADTLDRAWDINSPGGTGTPVRAFLDGIVTRAVRQLTSYGNYAMINHQAANLQTLYAHMSKLYVRAGQHVDRGEMIGREGSVGNSSGPHLHFEIGGGQSAIRRAGTGGSWAGGGGGGMTTGQIVQSVLKTLYPKSERAAKAMDGVHPLWPGDISEVINRLAKKKIGKLIEKYGAPGGDSGYGLAGLPSGARFSANAKGVWDALRAVGFNKIHTAGIMGNMLHESGFDPHIIQGGGHSMNPGDAGSGGYGLVQWTPGRKLTPYLHGKLPTVATEVNALAAQLSGRGSSPEGAAGAALRATRTVPAATIAFETKYERHADPPIQPGRQRDAQAFYRRYAADGAVVSGAQQMTVGEAGPEAVIPLNDRGANFMRDVMASTMGGRGVTPALGAGTNVYNTSIDRSTNFTGAITVQANNPQELIGKLKARQRVMALSRPSLTGSAA